MNFLNKNKINYLNEIIKELNPILLNIKCKNSYLLDELVSFLINNTDFSPSEFRTTILFVSKNPGEYKIYPNDGNIVLIKK